MQHSNNKPEHMGKFFLGLSKIHTYRSIANKLTRMYKASLMKIGRYVYLLRQPNVLPMSNRMPFPRIDAGHMRIRFDGAEIPKFGSEEEKKE